MNIVYIVYSKPLNSVGVTPTLISIHATQEIAVKAINKLQSHKFYSHLEFFYDEKSLQDL